MKFTIREFFSAGSLGLVLAFAASPAMAQRTATGEAKQSGSEVKHAGTSMGHNMKRGHVVRGGKHFGKHMGRAGKHFGHSSKKFFKKVVS